MLVDLHTHTLHYSTDSGLRLDALLGRARERGLNGVCLTEHNALWDPDKLEQASAEHDLAVFQGMEITTEFGHMLVFGLPAFRVEMFRLERLIDLVASHNGALVLPHPQRITGARPSLQALTGDFHALEAFNGGDGDGYSQHLLSVAANLGMGSTGGSDAHSIGDVGTCATRFPFEVRSQEEFVRALRTGRTQGVSLGRR